MPMYTVIEESNITFITFNTLSAIHSHGRAFIADSAKDVVSVWLNCMFDEGYMHLDEPAIGRLIVLEEGKEVPSAFPWTYEPPEEQRGDINVGVETVFEVSKEER